MISCGLGFQNEAKSDQKLEVSINASILKESKGGVTYSEYILEI